MQRWLYLTRVGNRKVTFSHISRNNQALTHAVFFADKEVSKCGQHAGHGQHLAPLQCNGKIAGQARGVHWRRVRVHIWQYSYYISEH
jgi:hypothetical protein